MREHREQIVFLVAVVLLGLLTWSKLDDGYTRRPTPAPKYSQAEAVTLPARVRLGGFDGTATGERGSSAFAPPRELLPLDPLSLPDPPLPALDVRRPAVSPGRAEPAAYRVSGESLGSLVLPDELERGAGLGSGAVAPAPAAGTGSAGAPDVEASPDDLFDWVVRAGSTLRTYGRILNDDVYTLATRPNADLVFQQITLRTGRPLGVPFEIPRSDVAEYGLARTFDNLYEMRSRSLGRGAGAVRARSELALEMLAAAGREERALEFAEAEARKAYVASPTDPSTLRLLTTVLREAQDLEGLMAVYRSARAEGVADAPLLVGHAALARELGLVERAHELLEAADMVSNTGAEVHTLRGILLADEGRHAEALESFARANALRFSPPFEKRQERMAALARGRSLVAVGREPEARREAERLLLEDADDAQALHLLGASYAAEGQLGPAADAFARALGRAPTDAQTLTAAGLVAWRQGDGGAALRLLERARQAEPWRAFDATVALGFLHEDAGQPTRARDLYEEALRLSPNDPEALYRLGRLQRASGDPDAAHGLLRRALRLGGADVLLLAELGTAMLQAGEPGAAGGYLREALRLAPGDAQVLWLLGLAHLQEGDLLGAEERLAEAAAAGASGAHGALAVARYRLGAEQDALDQFDEVLRAFAGAADHPQAQFAAAQAAAIRDNLSKRQWLDVFGRTQLQRGWVEQVWDGSPKVILSPGGVRVVGRMEKPREDERPGIARTVDGRSLVSVEAGLIAADQADSRLGLSLTLKQIKGVLGQLPKGRLEIWVDAGGEVRLSVLDQFETKLLDGVSAGVKVPRGTRVALGIERVDAVTGEFAFTVDGRRVGSTVTLKSMRDLRNNTLHLVVFAEAPPGRSVDVEIDLVRIVQLP